MTFPLTSLEIYYKNN